MIFTEALYRSSSAQCGSIRIAHTKLLKAPQDVWMLFKSLCVKATPFTAILILSFCIKQDDWRKAG